jgi:transcriptional regulator of acetoin/glycerol metabolism
VLQCPALAFYTGQKSGAISSRAGDNVQKPSPALALRQARTHLLEHGNCPTGAVNDRLARSWQRSIAAGLLPTGRLTRAEHATAQELRNTLARNHELLAHSRPVMEYLFEQVKHNQSVVILADNRGTLMHALGDDYFLSKAERVALSCGASWHEDHRGTNAIGTALAESHGVEIHGAEHFLERNGFLTCAAAPIMSATGLLMGVLDISGDQHSGHPHTLGLVNTAARMIENRLVTAACRRHVRLHLHAQPEGIGSVAEGIVAVSGDGWVVGGNRIGLALLGLAAPDLGHVRLESVIDLRLDELLSRHKRRLHHATQIRLHGGVVLFAQVHDDLASVSAIPLASRSHVLQNDASPVSDALSSLDTGDLRWRNAADKARRVLDKPIPLLIQGESGVGKEFFARAFHDSGPRKSAPFIAINCGAIPENLIEAELFGYEPGAFTGARREGSLGHLREAHGGTLFLDEIGDMPQGLQTRLLRVLQERCVTPLGGGKSVPVDFALVCATHSKLREAADAGTFRSDLYYRINGLTVLLPALRERTDFQALVERLLGQMNPGQDVHLAADLMARLAALVWPGNLRQLASVLRTASAMLDVGETCIEWQHLPDDLVDDLTKSAEKAAVIDQGQVPKNLDEMSRSAVNQALESSRGNISQAARSLGISRQTLYRKMNTGQASTELRQTH